ncbi:dethiobiotin synthase [Rhodococcus sp. CSLK01-03]|uniref:ATP-dependent dethiobiotin synthetase BioD n=1 Tax=Rhodococcus indonesiensis TaxID=3055869 RepID=A0ABT7RKY4_9NOCA|nr:dethiobiotin synthase [Rhodococcus indonesiensis]MDM7488278.1 dethiobiotin synthase [Rhodococcus indonesiensis]
MTVLCVTGTSTDVGKTVVTAAYAAVAAAAGLRVAVCKPAQTGVADDAPGDLAEITRLTGGRVHTVELARYPEPLAPDTAARRSDRPLLRLPVVVAAVRALADEYDLVLVEGAGGLLVRLGRDGFTLLDVAAAVSAPAVVVAAPALGTLNHSALTVAALKAGGVECAGVVIGAWPEQPGLAEQCNLQDLPEVTGVPLLGRIPAGSGALDAVSFAEQATRWLPADRLGMPVRT